MDTDKAINLFIGLALLFAVVAALYPTTATYGNQLNATGFPLGNLFVGGGVIFIIVAAVMIKSVLKKGGNR